jgi:hypothetical protein
MNPEANLRKSLIRTAASLPKGSSERKAVLDLLGAPQRKVAGLPRATRRPPGPKFRKQMNDWITADTQSKLEAGGCDQQTIDGFIDGLTGSYGAMLATTYSGGYGSQNYANFETQQDAVDWLAGKSKLERAPSSALGMKRYTDIHPAVIAKYGAGNDAIKDKARGMFNKLKPYQKAFVAVVTGWTRGSGTWQYSQDDYAKEIAEVIERSSGDVVTQLIPYIEWAAKVPAPPKKPILL